MKPPPARPDPAARRTARRARTRRGRCRSRVGVGPAHGGNRHPAAVSHVIPRPPPDWSEAHAKAVDAARAGASESVAARRRLAAAGSAIQAGRGRRLAPVLPLLGTNGKNPSRPHPVVCRPRPRGAFPIPRLDPIRRPPRQAPKPTRLSSRFPTRAPPRPRSAPEPKSRFSGGSLGFFFLAMSYPLVPA